MDFSFLPIWDLAAWQVLATLVFIDLGMILIIRVVAEGRFYWTRWRTFFIGDWAGLPVYGAFASLIVSQGHHPDVWWAQWYTHLTLLLLGWGIQLVLQPLNYKTGQMSLDEIFCPSEIYHAIIFGVMFYMVASTITPVILDHDPIWSTVGALVGLFIWLGCFVLDILDPLPKTRDEMERQAIWKMSWWPCKNR